MRGRTVCRAHGGATPRGVASPHFKHGRWSRDLPALLAEQYEAARQDKDLLSLREEIALVDALIGTTLSNAGDPLGRLELGRLIDQRRRMVESEIKHQILAGQGLAVEQAMVLAGALAATVRDHVQDLGTLKAIQRDLEGLLGSVKNT